MATVRDFQLVTSALCLKLSPDFVFRSLFVSSLSRLFATALPLLEASYAYGCAVRSAFRKDDSKVEALKQQLALKDNSA